MAFILPNPVDEALGFLNRHSLWVSWGLYALLLTWLAWIALPVSVLLSLWLAGGAYCSWFGSWLFFRLHHSDR